MSMSRHWAPFAATLSPLFAINELPCCGIKAFMPQHLGHCLLHAATSILPCCDTEASSYNDILVHAIALGLLCHSTEASVLIFCKFYACSLNYYDMLDVLSNMYFSLFLRENAYNAKNRVFLTRNGKRKALSIRGILKT